MSLKKLLFLFALSFILSEVSAGTSSDLGDGTHSNPAIFADVPDCTVLRDGPNYYMASTTMHMSPGVPIMKSTDLINWETVNYVYERLAETDECNLINGKSMYGKGSWAASLKKRGDTYYCTFMSYTTGKTYIFHTKDIENGAWTKYEIQGGYHDLSLVFTDDGRAFFFYGNGKINFIELNHEATAIKEGGERGELYNGARIPGVGNCLFEGTQELFINGMFYVFNIAWPNGKPRTVVCSRSRSIHGPWEHKIVLQTDFHGAGVAQGNIVDTPDGKWYGFFFKDNGPVGRSPCVLPITWIDGWPIGGEGGVHVSDIYPKPNNLSEIKSIVYSDHFDGKAGKLRPSGLATQWQWNHNPNEGFWSLKDRPSFLRLTTGSLTHALNFARNTLTTRTYGPRSSAETVVDVSHMKEGDVAGLTCFAFNYAYIAVKMEFGKKQVVMVNAPNSQEHPIQNVELPPFVNNVYFRVDAEFGNKAEYFYSFDGKKFNHLGNSHVLIYEMTHFMGYRFGLFNFATKEIGGYVDFDYFTARP